MVEESKQHCDVFSSEDFTPLHAEELEKYERWYCLEPNSGWGKRAKILYEQLKVRPNPWGVGLWKDGDTEEVAKRCAEIFIENFLECPNDRLVPQDRMEMVFALNDSGDLEDVEAIDQIESEFECKIPKEFFTSEKTFADFVECVKAGRGKTPLEEVTTKDWLSLSWWLAVLLFLVVGLPSYAIYRLCIDIRTIVLEGWSDVSIGSIIAESFGAAAGLYVVVGIVWAFLKKDGDPDSRITKM